MNRRQWAIIIIQNVLASPWVVFKQIKLCYHGSKDFQMGVEWRNWSL